jgi:hypothetical protein
LPFKDIPSVYQKHSVWDEEQGYVINISKVGNSDVIVVWGTDEQGALYGCVTLTKLINGNQKDGTYIRKAEVIDWPDFKYRMPNGLRFFSLASAKQQIDWCLRYKFNLLFVFEMKNWKNLKEIHEYAQKRGIRVMHMMFLNIGSIKKDAKDPRFKGAAQYNGNYYCWSRDELFDKRIEQIQKFIKETGANALMLHCMDSYDAGWPERCEKCRARFGDDRATADAHIINRTVRGLRKANKDIMLCFVAQPYGLNLNLPGNAKYKDYYQRLTNSIPADIYLTCVTYNQTLASSWLPIIKQPLLRCQNGATFQRGRYFDSSPCYFKGIFSPGSKDIAFLNEPIPAFDGDIIQLVGMEYEWNTQAPGALVLKEDQRKSYLAGPYHVKDCEIENVDAIFTGDGVIKKGTYSNTLQPKATCTTLLDRVCRSLYGANIAPYMTAFLREGVKGCRAARVAIKVVNNSAEGEQAYRQADNAVKILQQGMSAATNSFEKGTVKRFYNRVMLVRCFYRIYTLVLRAEEAARKENVDSAKQLVAECRTALKEGKEELKNKNIYNSKTIDQWFEPLLYDLENISTKIGFIESKRKMRTSNSKDHISVAIYEPSKSGGKVFPFQTLYNSLIRNPLFKVCEISDLDKKTLDNYQVVIIPQIIRFAPGDEDRYRENLRQFVIKKGGGVYFEHDAVGIYRGQVKSSVFPEICAGAQKREESTKVKIIQAHFLLDLKEGDEKEHMYFDHWVLKSGPKGDALLGNLQNQPVVIIGEIGKGRVIFNGMATLARDGKEKRDADLIDKMLINNGVKWLCGQKRQPNNSQADNLIDDPSFENVQDEKCMSWTRLQASSSAHSGKYAGKMVLSTKDKYSIGISRPFKIEAGKKYYVGFWFKKDKGFRVCPMMVFRGSKGNTKLITVNLPQFAQLGAAANHTNDDYIEYFGVINAPDDKNYTTAFFKLHLDWFGGDRAGPKTFLIDDITVYKTEKE